MEIDLEPAVREKLKKIIGRCSALANAAIQIQNIYSDEATSEDQRNFLETMIGAGIWYLDSKGIPTNKISVGVLKDYHPDRGVKKPKYTEDHEYPRKVAARELLKFDWSGIDVPAIKFFELYNEKYGRVNYVTSTENKSITKYQRVSVFTTPEKAYEQAGIKLVEVADIELSKVKARDRAVIERLLNSV